jgi:hypothetical protein
LEEITITILQLHIAVRLIIRESTRHFWAVRHKNSSPPHTSVVRPLTFVVVPVSIVVNTGGIPFILLKITLEEFPVWEQDLCLPIHHLVTVESSLDYLIR